MHSLSNTTNLKLQAERRMSYELETANCTPQCVNASTFKNAVKPFLLG